MASSRIQFQSFALVFLLFSLSEAREFVVGGKENSWKIPSSPDEFNKWAGEMRFRIGDSIVLKYDSKTDSVLRVTEEDYKSCNTAKPIRSYSDGDTKIVLDRSGPFFFISGAEAHCEKGEKLVVTVLSSKHGPHAPSPMPTPVPLEFHAPAPAPASGGDCMGVGLMNVVMSLGSLVGFALV